MVELKAQHVEMVAQMDAERARSEANIAYLKSDIEKVHEDMVRFNNIEINI